MLNNSQLEAVLHTNGPAMIVAGPGSGKTYTIIQRILNLINNSKISPNQICVLTFSKNAANEMKQRYYNETNNYDVHFATFHSLAFYLLRTYFNYNKYTVISENEKIEILKHLFLNHGLNADDDSEVIYSILDRISFVKNTKGSDNELKESFNYECTNDKQLNILMPKIINEYFEYLLEVFKIDFDDMIIICIEKLKNNPDILKEITEKFKYFLIDEFQDINYPQYEMINLLRGRNNNLFVVGDDDQSIYGFRGAKPSIMQNFIIDNPDAKKIFLTENYRCKSKIVELSSKIISDNINRFSKVFNPINNGGNVSFMLLDTKKDEEEYLVNMLKKYQTDLLSNTAMIVRTNREVALWKKLLIKNDIRVSSLVKEKNSILDSFIFADILAFYKYIYHGNKRSDFIKFMNKPNRFIQRSALAEEVISEQSVLNYYTKNQNMVASVKKLFKMLELCKKSSVNTALTIFRKSLGYDKYIDEISKNKDDYTDNIQIVERISRALCNYKMTENLEMYLKRCFDADKNSSSMIMTDGINIITMHTAKGLEYENVIIPDVNEGVIPLKNAVNESVEEERRLFYVAVTRAKEKLIMTATKERNRDISRFVKKYI